MERMKNGTAAGELSCLTGVRGIMNLIVMLHHFSVTFFSACFYGVEEWSHCDGMDITLGKSPLAFLVNGNSAVIEFFILSGIGIYLMSCAGESRFHRFLTLRYFKLVTLTVVSAFFVMAMWKLDAVVFLDVWEKLKTPWFDGWASEPATSFGRHLLNRPLDSMVDYSAALWPMRYFFFGTFFCAAVIWLGNRSRRPALFIALAAVLTIHIGEPYYCACVAGVALAYAYKKNRLPKLTWWSGGLCLLAGLYLFGYPTMISADTSPWYVLLYAPGMTVYYHILGASLLCLAAIAFKPAEKFFQMRAVQWMGKHSAAAYVIHYTIVISLSPLVFEKTFETCGYVPAAFCAIGAGLAAIYLIAFGLQPLLDWLYRLYQAAYTRAFSIEDQPNAGRGKEDIQRSCDSDERIEEAEHHRAGLLQRREPPANV